MRHSGVNGIKTAFSLSSQPISREISGPFDSTPITVKDTNLLSHTSVVVQTTCKIYPAIPQQYLDNTPVFSSSNPSVATVDQDGVVSYVSDGSVEISVSVPGLRTASISVTVNESSRTLETFDSFVSGSLGAHVTDQVITLIGAQTPPSLSGNPPFPQSLLNIFQPFTIGVTTTPMRNSSVWSGALDLTCIPYGYFNGVLVTKRHVICAAHFGPWNIGEQFIFVGNDNAQYVRTAVAISPHNVKGSPLADFLIVTLNEDLPDAITPVKILPTSQSHLPQMRQSVAGAISEWGYPALFTNQDKTLLIGEMDRNDDSIGIDGAVYIRKPTTSPALAGWYYPTRDHDSGDPMFILINGRLVLLSVTWGAGPSGFNLAYAIEAVNAQITANGSPYAVQTVDLSAFPTY